MAEPQTGVAGSPEGLRITSDEPLGARLATELIKLIKDRGLSTGDSLPSETEIAATFGVSTRIVRDALRTLRNHGIIVTSQGRKAAIAHFDAGALSAFFRHTSLMAPDAIAELFELRMALETAAAGMAARRGRPEHLAVAQAALVRLEAAGDDPEAWVDANLDFHAAVVRSAGNQFFDGIFDGLRDSLRSERMTGTLLRREAGLGSERTIREHREIASFIGAGDSNGAETAMRAHLQHTYTRQRELRHSGQPGERS